MVDSKRIRAGLECLPLVAEVAAILSRRRGGWTHVLEVTTYFPLDVDRVGRMLESLEEQQGVKRIQRDAICYIQIDEPDHFSLRELDLEKGEHLQDASGLLKVLSSLKEDEDWLKKVREQHELLHIVAGAKHRQVELAYLTSRSDIPSAKIQSVLNDFGAQGYIDIDYDEDADTLIYTFPEFEYPRRRLQNNMNFLAGVEAKMGPRISIWVFIALSALILLAIVILVRL